MIEVVSFTAAQAERAVEAFLQYGKGRRHSARLNFGDCLSYALASDLGSPLLFKVNDFAASDIQSAAGISER